VCSVRGGAPVRVVGRSGPGSGVRCRGGVVPAARGRGWEPVGRGRGALGPGWARGPDGVGVVGAVGLRGAVGPVGRVVPGGGVCGCGGIRSVGGSSRSSASCWLIAAIRSARSRSRRARRSVRSAWSVSRRRVSSLSRASAAAFASCGRPHDRQPTSASATPPQTGHGYVSTTDTVPGQAAPRHYRHVSRSSTPVRGWGAPSRGTPSRPRSTAAGQGSCGRR